MNCLKRLIITLTVFATVAATSFPGPQEEAVSYRITGDIYFGDQNHFSNPCVLKRSKIFAKIPAYQQIKREGLDESSARYYFLLEETNRVFRAHVKKVAEELGYDLTVEKGGIKASDEQKIEEITREVLKSLEG